MFYKDINVKNVKVDTVQMETVEIKGLEVLRVRRRSTNKLSQCFWGLELLQGPFQIFLVVLGSGFHFKAKQKLLSFFVFG